MTEAKSSLAEHFSITRGGPLHWLLYIVQIVIYINNNFWYAGAWPESRFRSNSMSRRVALWTSSSIPPRQRSFGLRARQLHRFQQDFPGLTLIACLPLS